jgi:hypothetical protein
MPFSWSHDLAVTSGAVHDVPHNLMEPMRQLSCANMWPSHVGDSERHALFQSEIIAPGVDQSPHFVFDQFVEEILEARMEL